MRESVPMGFEEWLKRYPENKRQQLRNAKERVESRGLLRGDAIVECFIKNETSTKATDPRNISPRRPEFLAILGPFIAGIEQASHGAEYLVKGLNIADRHRRLRWMKKFREFIENDHSRFDKHVDYSWVDSFEVVLFMLIYPASDYPDLWTALEMLAKSFGTSVVGLLYMILGQRLSGDAHTSIGNGNINFAQLLFCFTGLRWAVDWQASTEGDDGVVGIAAQLRCCGYLRMMMMGCLGYSVKMIHRLEITGTMFCGRTMVEEPNGVTSMCDLKRSLAKFHITMSGLPSRRAILAKAFSYWSTDACTPVIGALCYSLLTVLQPVERDITHLLRSTSTEKRAILAGWEGWNKMLSLPTAAMRAAATECDGFAIDVQQAFEELYRSWAVQGFVPARPPPILVHEEPHVDDDRSSYFGSTYPAFYGPSQ